MLASQLAYDSYQHISDMAERDAATRLRKAIKENNLFLVKRLVQRTDIRNPDSASRRYTSLAWAAALGHEEVFEFLLTHGHDDEELSKDSENNTILMLLSEVTPPPTNPYLFQPPADDILGAALRMARMYHDRYPWILDWSNSHGKTCLHMASLKGNEELARMLCDLGADVDLSDNKGNTPLHYASAWGHITIVQLLIERGCQYAARNNEGFTASDYSYSYDTRDILQETARVQFENNKRLRRTIFAQAAARGSEWGAAANLAPPLLPKDQRIRDGSARMRSGSGGSRASDGGDLDSGSIVPSPLMNGQSISASSSPSQLPTRESPNGSYYHGPTSASTTASPPPPHPISLHPSANPATALSPIATRMRERDADAMEKYMRRNRSGSSGTASTTTDTKSQNGSTSTISSIGPSSNGIDATALSLLSASGSTTAQRRLRPSMSAAQLRASTGPAPPPTQASQPAEARSRSGTNPSNQPQMTIFPLSHFTRSTSTSTSPRALAFHEENIFEEPETYVGPSSQFAQFPDPPTEFDTSTPTTRRIGFNILPKSLSGFESSGSHRRGSSATSFRLG